VETPVTILSLRLVRLLEDFAIPIDWLNARLESMGFHEWFNHCKGVLTLAFGSSHGFSLFALWVIERSFSLQKINVLVISIVCKYELFCSCAVGRRGACYQLVGSRLLLSSVSIMM
jgi:hypothetical protein